MSSSGDLIDFEVIEGQKENIQSLPGGRSAKKLAQLYSPRPLEPLSTPTPGDTREVNDSIRAEYEAEVQNIGESDDPLDVYDRYVRWTFEAYPSAQATPASQLHTLLERATKAFVSSNQYKNDPRYLKLWIHYIHFFSDAPRETYMFLSRHGIGETLALFYEEYAEWLESAGRWAQAEEVYKLGIEREARPVARLLRKFKEFEERQAQLAQQPSGPSSPALPTVRPALAAKSNPFGAGASTDPQAQRQGSSSGTSKPKAKMAIFSDADAKAPALSTRETGSKGWATIGTMSERKKENTVEAKPWVGETLQAGGKKPVAPKMSVFRDPTLSRIENIVVVPSKNQVTVHPTTGKRERIYVDLAAIYPTPEEAGTELSFEEIVADNRGWLQQEWDQDFEPSVIEELPNRGANPPVKEKLFIPRDDKSPGPKPPKQKVFIPRDDENAVEQVQRDMKEKLVIRREDESENVFYDENGAIQPPPPKPRGSKKKKVMEDNKTQIIKAKLDSPSGPKLKKRNQSSEATMTIHTRAATDDIYDIFNAPLKDKADLDSGEDDYMTDGDYTTDGESTGTTRQVEEDDEVDNDEADEGEEDAQSVSAWSDFDTRRHVPNIEGSLDESEPDGGSRQGHHQEVFEGEDANDWELRDGEYEGPVASSPPDQPRTQYIPVPPEDYEPPTRPYRDAAEVANSRLPFMTPITERTEVSLDVTRDFKTPSRGSAMKSAHPYNDEPLSSPIRELLGEDDRPPVPKVPVTFKQRTVLGAKAAKAPPVPKGPIVKEAQCNPVDAHIRQEILEKMHPPLSSYDGFFDQRHERYEGGGEIRRYIRTLQKSSGSSRTSYVPEPIELNLPASDSQYIIRRQLGAGAFAPVYLVENVAAEDQETDGNATPAMGKGAFAVQKREKLEALKMEAPPTPWEFHMMRLAHARIGSRHRASASLSYAHEMHIYQNEAFLFLPFHPHGTLLDVVNLFRAKDSGLMEEALAMFFSIELLRTVEELHAKSILHGDLKADNCLLRLDDLDTNLSGQWQADGSGGWSSRGVVLIDFGRGIDMRNFSPEVEFIADWQTTAQDCNEMREGRPWTWQIDYYGLAGTIHCLLFGKYIETQRADQGGAMRGQRRYKIREGLKRYWQQDLWAECFDVLLNPGAFVDAEENRTMPVLNSMRVVREKMEDWLSHNSEKGSGLKYLITKVAEHAKARK